MLDVHPPHHPTHTWKDFFIHVATICVGLLIAVGLEQAVEAVHHHHQRRELRESLRVDAENTVRDTANAHAAMTESMRWLTLRIQQVQHAIATGQPLAAPPPVSSVNFEAPDDPAWKAAKSSDLAELLTQEEIKIYSDIDGDVAIAERFHLMTYDARANFIQFNFAHSDQNSADTSSVAPQDLKEYLDLLATWKKSDLIYSAKCQELHGAEAAILRGEDTLHGIQRAETNPW